jgi:hypothetical protein
MAEQASPGTSKANFGEDERDSDMMRITAKLKRK